MTPSEELVARLCRRSFLALWSLPTPKGKKGKELCDVLIVCDPDVVIVSVKDIALPPRTDGPIAKDRWRRRALDESIIQIFGAERWLASNERVAGGANGHDMFLPPMARRRTHRVAVALGGGGLAPLAVPDGAKGFVHVLDEGSLDAIMGRLDTIKDFTEYLLAKENFLGRGRVVQVPGGEKDLLAIYLNAGRLFPAGTDAIRVEPGSWEGLNDKPDFLSGTEANEVSYVWDGLIEIFAEDALAGTLVGNATLEGTERALRFMAREDRFARRILSRSWLEFHAAATRKEIRSRITQSPSGITYVFLAAPQEEARELRQTELMARCIVARGRAGVGDTVVGIATEHYVRGGGFSLDLCALTVPVWTPDHAEKAAEIQKSGGFFESSRVIESSEDEYPRRVTGNEP